MNDKQLIEFLKQNNLIRDPDQSSNSNNNQGSIFRAIVSGDIPSYKIDENNVSIAVLEINPASKGHVIIIPKYPVSSEKEIPKLAFSLAENISKKLQTKLKAQDINISSSNILGEEIINIIPIYKDTPKNPQKYKAEESELEFVQKTLEEKAKKEVIKKPKRKVLKNIRLPKRIP